MFSRRQRRHLSVSQSPARGAARATPHPLHAFHRVITLQWKITGGLCVARGADRYRYFKPSHGAGTLRIPSTIGPEERTLLHQHSQARHAAALGLAPRQLAVA